MHVDGDKACTSKGGVQSAHEMAAKPPSTLVRNAAGRSRRPRKVRTSLEECRVELSGRTQRRDEKEAFEEEMRARVAEGKKPQSIRCTEKGKVDDRDVYRRANFFEYMRALAYKYLDVSIQKVADQKTADKKAMRREVKK